MYVWKKKKRKLWDSAVLIIGIELSLRIVHYDFKGGSGWCMQFSRALFFFLTLVRDFFWRAISCARILFNIKNRTWGVESNCSIFFAHDPLARLYSTSCCAWNVPNRPPLPLPQSTLRQCKFENAAIFLPILHSNPSRKWSSWKRSSNLRNLKTLAFRFHVVGKYFESDDVDGKLLMCC